MQTIVLLDWGAVQVAIRVVAGQYLYGNEKDHVQLCGCQWGRRGSGAEDPGRQPGQFAAATTEPLLGSFLDCAAELTGRCPARLDIVAQRPLEHGCQRVAQVGSLSGEIGHRITRLARQHLLRRAPGERNTTEQREARDCRQRLEVGALVHTLAQQLFR